MMVKQNVMVDEEECEVVLEEDYIKRNRNRKKKMKMMMKKQKKKMGGSRNKCFLFLT